MEGKLQPFLETVAVPLMELRHSNKGSPTERGQAHALFHRRVIAPLCIGKYPQRALDAAHFVGGFRAKVISGKHVISTKFVPRLKSGEPYSA